MRNALFLTGCREHCLALPPGQAWCSDHLQMAPTPAPRLYREDRPPALPGTPGEQLPVGRPAAAAARQPQRLVVAALAAHAPAPQMTRLARLQAGGPVLGARSPIRDRAGES